MVATYDFCKTHFLEFIAYSKIYVECILHCTTMQVCIIVIHCIHRLPSTHICQGSVTSFDTMEIAKCTFETLSQFFCVVLVSPGMLEPHSIPSIEKISLGFTLTLCQTHLRNLKLPLFHQLTLNFFLAWESKFLMLMCLNGSQLLGSTILTLQYPCRAGL